MRGRRRTAARVGLLVIGGLFGCSYPVTLGSQRQEDTEPALDLDAPVPPGDPGVTEVVVEVASNASRHPISPLIYGIRLKTDFELNRQALFSVAQLRWSTYNWENNASNWGYGTNQNDGALSNSDLPGQAVVEKGALADAIPAGVTVLLVIPIGACVAADRLADGDVRNSGANYLTTRFFRNLSKKDAPLSIAPDAGDQAVYQDEFVNWVKSRYPSARLLFALDDEPDLWTDTLYAARPEALTYGELVQRNLEFSQAIKRIWPEAPVVGLTSFGWTGWTYLTDPRTNLQPPDAQGEFIDYYLSGVQHGETTFGRRLIDYVDLHWWFEVLVNGAKVRDKADGTGADARVQGPRSLWDPSYVEDSWITQYATGGNPIQLIPRIQAKIQALYPGTQLAIGSWNFGGSAHISGAIAVADSLGVFGRGGLGMAALANAEGPFSLAGFRVFTNFDGQGARFGDTSIAAQVSDAAAASAYASIDQSAPERLVLVLINKRNLPTSVGIKLAHPLSFTNAEVYELGPGNPAITHRGVLPATATNAFVYPMPPLTVAVVLPKP
jgi:hypothetical protein